MPAPPDCRIAAVICAGGYSSRMGGLKKEYRRLTPPQYDEEGLPLSVLGAAYLAFDRVERVGSIVIVIPCGHEKDAQKALPRGLKKGCVRFVTGGDSRQNSVYRALSFLAEESPDYVLIHDGARPWVDSALINRVIDAAMLCGAAIPRLPLIETPKECNEEGFITRHLKRHSVFAAQTPQGFVFKDIFEAHKRSKAYNDYTDDAEIWGECIEGRPVATVLGAKSNRKITFIEDL